MNKALSILFVALLASAFVSTTVLADPKGKDDWESRKEQMKNERERMKRERELERKDVKKQRETEREERKRYKEMEREERKHQEEMEREERKHRKEMQKENREYERERDYGEDDRAENSTESVEEEVIRQGRKWWEVWKSSE